MSRQGKGGKFFITAIDDPSAEPRRDNTLIRVGRNKDTRMSKMNANHAEPKPFRLYTVKETAKQLASSEKTVRRLIDRGELRSHNIGRSIRIDHEDLAAFLGSHG
jgi:excisionase family DNA binding protein